jgi:hypothetical protein
MPGPFVRVTCKHHSAVLRPGNLIGRLSTATLRVLDPRVSEAHALLVLRGRTLQLLALRGVLTIDGVPEDTIILAPGQRVGLADGLTLEVDELRVPDRVLALTVDDGEPFEPCAPVHALIAPTEWVPAWRPGALAHVYASDTGWMIEVGDRLDRLVHGAAVAVGPHVLRAVLVPVDQVGTDTTELARPREALVISARFDTATVLPTGREPCHINGLPARVLTELAELGSPVDWDVAAAEVWPDEPDRDRRRRSFDRAVERLRQRLREHNIRPDLVRTNGRGVYELFLMPGDVVQAER